MRPRSRVHDGDARQSGDRCGAGAHGRARTYYFEPNIGLVSQNYLENRDRYYGIGNFDDQGSSSPRRDPAEAGRCSSGPLKTGGLTLLMGTDAGAGAHGRSAEEIIYRVQVAGQPAADALRGHDVASTRSLSSSTGRLARIAAWPGGRSHRRRRRSAETTSPRCAGSCS